MANVDTAASLARDEYVEFFRSLGLTNNNKVAFLARQLQTFYDIAITLDEHLSPAGAALHTAISRMCLPDNPLHAPQHRWIRVHDRLGFFSDEDEHSSRIVNIGLSYAYRHKELDALAEANALQLERLRLTAKPSGGEATRTPLALSGTSGDEVEVPIGGASIRHDGLPAARSGSPTASGAANGAALGDSGGNKKQRSTSDGHGDLDVPLGGSVLYKSADGAASGGEDLLPTRGGLIIARRTAGGASCEGALPPDETLVEVVAAAPSTCVESQPSLKPSTTAIRCIKEVLTAVSDHNNAKDVLRRLLCDGLLCWARLNHSHQVKDAPTGWPAVRTLLAKFWPTWQVPNGEPGRMPPVGSVANTSHAGRPTQSGKWAIAVDMSAINPVIYNMAIKSDRYFNKENLPAVVEVCRMGAQHKPPLPTTVACMLVVGTWENAFCSILTNLACAGRSRSLQVSPLVVATCHNFETAGLEESVSQQTGKVGTGDASDDDDPTGGEKSVGGPGAATTDDASPARPAAQRAERAWEAIKDQRQDEIDDMLRNEKITQAVARRANRIDIRRQERLSAASAPRPARSRARPAVTTSSALSPGARARAAGALPPRPRRGARKVGPTSAPAGKRFRTAPDSDSSSSRSTAVPSSSARDGPSASPVASSAAGDSVSRPAGQPSALLDGGLCVPPGLGVPRHVGAPATRSLPSFSHSGSASLVSWPPASPYLAGASACAQVASARVPPGGSVLPLLASALSSHASGLGRTALEQPCNTNHDRAHTADEPPRLLEPVLSRVQQNSCPGSDEDVPRLDDGHGMAT